MDAETVRVILERTFRMPVNESDARIVLGRLNEILTKEADEQNTQADEACDHQWITSTVVGVDAVCGMCGERSLTPSFHDGRLNHDKR